MLAIAFLAPLLALGGLIGKGAVAGGGLLAKGALAAGKAGGGLLAKGATAGGASNPLNMLGQQLGARAAIQTNPFGVSALGPAASPGGVGTAGGSTVPFGMTGSLPSTSIGLGANPALAPAGSALPAPGATTPGGLLSSLGPTQAGTVSQSVGVPGKSLFSALRGRFAEVPGEREEFKRKMAEDIEKIVKGFAESKSSGSGGGSGGLSPVPVGGGGVGSIGPSAGPVPPTGAEGFGGAGTQLAQLLTTVAPPQEQSADNTEFIKRLLAQGMASRALGGGF